MAPSPGTSPNSNALPPGLATPARRALAGAGISSLDDLARFTEAEVTALHGIGPNALRVLRDALATNGSSFATDR